MSDCRDHNSLHNGAEGGEDEESSGWMKELNPTDYQGLDRLQGCLLCLLVCSTLGIQSVQAISNIKSKSFSSEMQLLSEQGLEKWMDPEIWNSVADCIKNFISCNCHVASTHLGIFFMLEYDMDWSTPVAIVVRKYHMGKSKKMLEILKLHRKVLSFSCHTC